MLVEQFGVEYKEYMREQGNLSRMFTRKEHKLRGMKWR